MSFLATFHSQADNPGYCLWLVPSGTQAAALQSLVNDLAPLVDAPEFVPHITLCAPKGPARDSSALLLAAVEEALAAEDPAQRGPMTLTLNKPQGGTFYYQCVLAPVDQSAGDAARLLSLQKATNENAKNTRKENFFPHLSLIYGDLDADKKAEMAEEAAKRGSFPEKIVVEEAVLVDVNGTAEEVSS